MALADDIRGLGTRSLTALSAAHDYYTHTVRLWRLLQAAVLREGLTVNIRNSVTGSRVNERDLSRLAQEYITEHLASATFLQFVSLFEDFFFDLLSAWLTAHPGSLGRRHVELATILQASSTTEVVQTVIERELNELRYKRLSDWCAYLHELVNLPCPTGDEVKALAEVKASRDILVHNKGIVNATYLSKAGSRARFTAGQRLDLPEAYHRESWVLIRKVIQDVSVAAAAKA